MRNTNKFSNFAIGKRGLTLKVHVGREILIDKLT